ncbi:hypothetical protein BDV93DRAFT_528894 [Ceratobasidium sp. AG-I]|nr:hypothetical protein BDV93DRAFT_528894 [Ceratobasidium sp. AG-I]
MLALRVGFDYPITRPYPWRFTTSAIVAVSMIIFAGLFYFNMAVVGLTSTPYLSTTFKASQDPSWTDRIDIRRILNRTLSCDPTTVVSGGTYKTRNSAFAYTIQSIMSADTGEEFSTLAYDGSALENCSIQLMSASIDYSILKIGFETTINCTLAGNIELISTFATPVFSEDITRAPPTRKVSPETQMARETNEMLQGFMHDVILQFTMAPPHSNTQCITDFQLGDGGFATKVYCSDGTTDEIETRRSVVNNLAKVLWSSVLLDLGTHSSFNILTDPERMRNALYSKSNVSPAIEHLWPSVTAVDDVLGNMTYYSLPFDRPQPVPFNARYLCRSMWWKTPTNLVVDVLVATSSLFMVYWGVLHFGLRYLATRSSPSGNHCVCPHCNDLLYHVSALTEMKQLRSVDDGPGYDYVPNTP